MYTSPPPFSPRLIASVTDADGDADDINSNDRNNSVNIINNLKPYFSGNETGLSASDIDVDIDGDVSYNNGFEIENAKTTGIKAVNNSGGNVDVVKHASIKCRATKSNNGIGNININIIIVLNQQILMK